jgi:hypothetical protein
VKRFIVLLSILFLASTAFAYDATFTFNQQYPELVAGWKIKAGPTKTGPYPHIIDCRKPAPNTDGTYSCAGTGLTANPIYAVAVNYNSAGVESATSNEATMSITVGPPTNLKVVVTVQTVSRLSKYGNPIATTTIKRVEVPQDKVVREGTSSYRNSRGEYVTNTTLVM